MPPPCGARPAAGLRSSCLPQASGSAPCSLVLGRNQMPCNDVVQHSGLRASLRAAASRAAEEAGAERRVPPPLCNGLRRGRRRDIRHPRAASLTCLTNSSSKSLRAASTT